MAIDPTGAGDVTETHVKWETEKNVPKSPSLLVIGDELYMVSDQGIATCLDAKTGEEVWHDRLGGNFSASPVYVDGRIYFQDENGTAIVIQAGKEFVELGRSTWGDGGRTFASFAIADGALFLRSETHVYRVEQGVQQTGVVTAEGGQRELFKLELSICSPAPDDHSPDFLLHASAMRRYPLPTPTPTRQPTNPAWKAVSSSTSTPSPTTRRAGRRACMPCIAITAMSCRWRS
jgi:hypothetical protein